ncbi:hypothetical protein L6452_38918 [Arctium lappa]|uniref:Uncharacterized protein n=1 Tax=Arctium lappa TaxID=4217 RepID=A0ACB8XS22_ARCLA|nr:hypothetical protein L6452_38918 [Arctium lappa]
MESCRDRWGITGAVLEKSCRDRWGIECRDRWDHSVLEKYCRKKHWLRVKMVAHIEVEDGCSIKRLKMERLGM